MLKFLYGIKWRSYVLTFSVLIFFSVSTPAQDLAILWDVSQSVFSSHHQNRYPESVRTAVASLVFGRGIGGDWSIPPTQNMPSPISRALSGTAPLIGEGSRVVVIRFGTRFRERYPLLPFFWHQDFESVVLHDLEHTISEVFPADATEQLTNKDLAMAAAAKYLFEQHSRQWVLLVVSDFAQDQRELSAEERQIRDSFISSDFVERSPAVVLRWRLDPDLQLYLEVDHSKNDQQETESEPETGIPVLKLQNPAHNKKFQDGARPIFSWFLSSKKPAEKYFLVVTRAGNQAPILERSTQTTSVTAPQQLSSGTYRWQVFAEVGGNSISSSPGTFIVEKGFPWWLVLLLLIIAASFVGVLYWNKRHIGEFHG
jgi:hypothetical protein